MLATALLLSSGLLAGAAQAEPARAMNKGAQLDMIQDALASVGGRKNEFHRLNGQRAWLKGDKRVAAEQFRLAAGFADKYSQQQLSLMYWQGDGVPKDRVQGYIWSDLAAERGTPSLLANRERMWAALNAAEREQVQQQGPDYYAKYGDQFAKPRQIGRMLAASRNHTGTRTGYDGYRLDMVVVQGVFFPQARNASRDFSVPVNAGTLYGPERSHPDLYWHTEDSVLGGGNVNVGDPASDTDARADKAERKARRKSADRLL